MGKCVSMWEKGVGSVWGYEEKSGKRFVGMGKCGGMYGVLGCVGGGEGRSVRVWGGVRRGGKSVGGREEVWGEECVSVLGYGADVGRGGGKYVEVCGGVRGDVGRGGGKCVEVCVGG